MSGANKDIEVRESSICGRGIFAKRRFESGEVVLRWNINELIARAEIDRLSPEERHYLLNFDGDRCFVVQPPERYINHSCDPNTTMGKFCDVAIRPIEIGEEVTSDYQDSSHVTFRCSCGAKNCRGEICSCR